MVDTDFSFFLLSLIWWVQTTWFKNGHKDLNRQFTNDDMWMASKHENKIKQGHHHNKNPLHNETPLHPIAGVAKACRTTGTLIHHWWKHK